MISKFLLFQKAALLKKPLFNTQLLAVTQMRTFVQQRKSEKAGYKDVGEDINIEQQKVHPLNVNADSNVDPNSSNVDPLQEAETRRDSAKLSGKVPKTAGASTDDPIGKKSTLRKDSKRSDSDKIVDEEMQNAETRRDAAAFSGEIKKDKKDKRQKVGSPEFEQNQTAYRGHPDNAAIGQGSNLGNMNMSGFNPVRPGDSFTTKSESFKIKAGNQGLDEQKVVEAHSKDKGFYSPDNESGMGLMMSGNPENMDKQKPTFGDDKNYANRETARKMAQEKERTGEEGLPIGRGPFKTPK
jgi:hypothetical protein